MPIDYKRYPPNWWTEIRPSILKRADNHCEWCGFENGQIIHRAKKDNKIYWFANEQQAKELLLYLGTAKVVLTIAHLDHDETNTNISKDRLAALCQRCHLRYDAKERGRRRVAGYDRAYHITFPPDLPGEIWEPIKGYESLYQVSNKTRIRTLSEISNKREQFYLTKFVNRKGYNTVSLWRNRRQNTRKVYRLVANAFIDNPLNLPEVNHGDGNKINDLPDNLEWSTSSDNQKHAYRMGLRSRSNQGVKNIRCKLTEAQVLEIYNSTEPPCDLAKIYPVKAEAIIKIRRGTLWGFLTNKSKIA